jgi:iron complex outermembrane receptor protein
VEIAAEWHTTAWWRWHAAYTYLRADDLHAIDGGNSVPYKFGYGGSSPSNQFYLRSSFDIGDRTELDVWMKRVGQLTAIEIPAYTSLNLRLGWKAQKNLVLSLVGENLFESRHAEFVTDDGTPRATQVPRSLFAQALLRF